MKNLNVKLILTITCALLTLSFVYAKDPVYKLTTQNTKNAAPNVLEFDIYLQHTNADDSKFNYIMGQYFFDFNSDIANGGKLTCSIIGSDLPSPLQPRNASISGNQLRLAVNTIPPKDNLPVISGTGPGTLIAKMRMETSADKFSETPLELKFRVGPDNPYTKIFAYTDNQIKDITISESAVTDNNPNTKGEVANAIPKEYALFQNYPNPFNPVTSIKFDIPKLSNVKLSIYDLTGRELTVLVNEELQPGSYDYKWNAAQYASGIYFYRIKSESFIQTKKMALIK